jgi:hypothetical protein
MSWRLKTRTDPRNRLSGARWWMGATLVAAGALVGAYLLDPANGHARRTRIAERTGHEVRRTRKRIARELRFVRKSVGGRVGHFIDHTPPTFADGRTLLDRVESELFEDRSIPHGRLNLEVEGTTVVLRGQLDSSTDITRIEAAALKIPGVGRVRNLLHLPGTPAPNKTAALVASAAAAQSAGWPEEAPPDVDSES